MVSAESFWTSTLRKVSEGEGITRILSAAINAVDPAMAVKRYVKRDGDTMSVLGKVYDLRSFRRLVVLGMGKASVDMSAALTDILAERISEGLVITKHAPTVFPANLTLMIGGHPIPDDRSMQTGKKTIDLVSSLGSEDLLICLISGGGSALVSAPVDGISLEDLQAMTTTLLAGGAPIDEINVLRRRLDKLKGGGLLKMTSGATVLGLILSDVVGNQLHSISSGPTSPDPTTRGDALAIIAKYGLKERIPFSILQYLKKSPETPKPEDPLFANVQNLVVGDNLHSAQAALAQAQCEGFHPYLYSTNLQGEARQVAFELSTMARRARLTGEPVSPPSCIVAGGETTVTLMGNGKGGRNTELALAAVTELAGFPGVMLVTLATDGEDGPTDAAGAVVTGETFRQAAELGLRPEYFLVQNDSYTFFSALNELLKPGPTGTNVNDLVFLFNY